MDFISSRAAVEMAGLFRCRFISHLPQHSIFQCSLQEIPAHSPSSSHFWEYVIAVLHSHTLHGYNTQKLQPLLKDLAGLNR